MNANERKKRIHLRLFAFICGHYSSAASPLRCRLPALSLMMLLSGSVGARAGEGLDPMAVIGFDLDRLDASGLQGPPDGLRALDYEFCIPAGPGPRDQVAAIDPSARFYPGRRGRIGCAADQVLVLGNTHQGGFREILLRLAGLPYVARIAEAMFE